MSRKKGPVAEKDLKTYPPSDYPYMLVFPNAQKPVYCRSHTEALGKVKGGLEKLADQFRHLDHQVVERCEALMSEAGELSLDGGHLNAEVDPHTKIRYRVTLVRRESAL